jgi:hypothetical protein
MNRHTSTVSKSAGTVAILAVTAGLVLAGCGGKSAPQPANTGTAPATNTSTSAAPATTSSAPATTTSAASVPFPIGVGNTWVYRTDSALTGTTGTATNKMTAVSPVSGGQQVTMLNSIDISGTHTQNSAIYVFHSDGSISYPIQNFSSTVSVTGASVFWPPAAEMASGHAYHSALHITLDENGTKVATTAHFTVQGDGSGSVTVPAGTYNATIVKMTESYSIEGHTSDIVITTWLASGIGPVQSEATLSELSLHETISKLQLVSFTKG